MKKIIMTLMLILFTQNIYAMAGRECTTSEIIETQNTLNNVSFNLVYVDDYLDINGNPKESMFKMLLANMPSNIVASVYTDDGVTSIKNSEEYAILSGGVHRISFYKTTCDTLIKTYEIRIPHYNEYCTLYNNCKENIWFDGTYENTASNQNAQIKNKINSKLVIILVILILFISAFAVFINRRRKIHVQDF